MNSIEIRRTGCVLSNKNSEIRADFLMKRSNVKVYVPMLIDLQRLYILREKKIEMLFNYQSDSYSVFGFSENSLPMKVSAKFSVST